MRSRYSARRWLCCLALILTALPTRAGDTLTVSSRPAAPDTSRRHKLLGTETFQRIMTEADSVLRSRGGSHAENAQLYLSWNAPWGMPRARLAHVPQCADSVVEDTLFLSFYPGRASSGFMGYTAQLQLHATGSDTLGTWWHSESKGGENGGSVRVEWGPSPDMPGRQPWSTPGRGFVLSDRTPWSVRLRLLFAMTLDDAPPLDSTLTYTLCRVIFRHHPERQLAGCGQPVCIEWEKSTFGFALKDEPEVSRGERFVSYGDGGAACEAFRAARVKAWGPKTGALKP
jgi:hypothetical protein